MCVYSVSEYSFFHKFSIFNVCFSLTLFLFVLPSPSRLHYTSFSPPLILNKCWHIFYSIEFLIPFKWNSMHSYYFFANRNMKWNGVHKYMCMRMQERIFCKKLYCIKFHTHIFCSKWGEKYIFISKSQMNELRCRWKYLRHKNFSPSLLFDWKSKSVCWFCLGFLRQLCDYISKKLFFVL